MNVCCKGLIFTKFEIRQISMACMKALEREEKEKQNETIYKRPNNWDR